MLRLILALWLGWITYYADGVMERVREYRGMECAECAGYVAVADCAYLGQVVYLQVEGQIVGPVMSVDCGQAEHRQKQEERGLVAELPHEMWQELGLPNRPVQGGLVDSWMLRQFLRGGD